MLGRIDYTDWELRKSAEGIILPHQSAEGRILLKSTCNEIHDNFGVPKTSLQRSPNVIFLPMKSSSLKHFCYLMSLREINDKIVRNKISENIFKQKLVQQTYLPKYK